MTIVNVWLVSDIVEFDVSPVWMGTFDSWATAEIFCSQFDYKDAHFSMVESTVLTVDDL